MLEIEQLITQAKSEIDNNYSRKKLLSLIDLTRLNTQDSSEEIEALCQSASTGLGNVAAICVYPKFIPLAKLALLGKPIKIATVVNFPRGNEPLAQVLIEIRAAIAAGAEEIDCVFPYQLYLQGKHCEAKEWIQACKACCGEEICLKVILETGELKTPEIIYAASIAAITAGANFLKTSTGKTAQGASLESVAAMLLAIKTHYDKTQEKIGIKISGGIREISDALSYFCLAKKIVGESWLTKQFFRFGSSQLLANILKE